jgi:hypothetical protein
MESLATDRKGILFQYKSQVIELRTAYEKRY